MKYAIKIFQTAIAIKIILLCTFDVNLRMKGRCGSSHGSWDSTIHGAGLGECWKLGIREQNIIVYPPYYVFKNSYLAKKKILIII